MEAVSAGRNEARPVATAWAQNAPDDWFAGQGQRTSKSLAERTITETASGRFPARMMPRQPDPVVLTSATAPESNRERPSLNACQLAALRMVVSFQRFVTPGFWIGGRLRQIQKRNNGEGAGHDGSLLNLRRGFRSQAQHTGARSVGPCRVVANPHTRTTTHVPEH